MIFLIFGRQLNMTENKSVDKRWENPQPLGINSLANSSSLRSDLYPARLFIPAGFGFSRSVINRIDIFMPIDLPKEFSKFIHNEALFS